MLMNITALRDELKRLNHPAVTIVQAALDKSNSAEFIEYAATALADAAKADKVEEQKLLASLSQALVKTFKGGL